MNLIEIDSGTEIATEVSSTLWRQAVLPSFVLAGRLALMAVLVVF